MNHPSSTTAECDVKPEAAQRIFQVLGVAADFARLDESQRMNALALIARELSDDERQTLRGFIQ